MRSDTATSPTISSGAPLLALRRSTAIACGAGFALLAAWAAGSTWYVLFRDDIVSQFVRRQSAMQYAYEERVSALRVRLDRMASQKLIEQDGVEARVADLASRQMLIENRQALLADLAETPARTDPAARLEAASRIEAARAAAARAPEPPPAPEGLGLRTRANDGASLGPSLKVRLAALDRALEASADAQGATLALVQRRAREEATRLRLAIAETGLNPDKLDPPRPGASGMGGPFVPVSGFEADLTQARRALEDLARIRPLARALPLHRPTTSEAGIASPFGYRVDPFTRSPALHTGVDLKAEGGTAARAAGGGVVVAAEWSGGYGNMVEIDHGHGITTRYAHLSGYTVQEGQRVEPGQIVGRVGSTGRSTGAHLHYEVRIDDAAVDPTRFLRAAAKLNPTPLLAAR